MPTLGPITLPPTPQPGGTPAEYRQRVDTWTRKCEQTIRAIETYLRAPGSGGAANGLPAGGSTNQVLTKTSGVDYAAGWATPHYIPAGGSANAVLTKVSGTDYDVAWTAPTAGSTDLSFFLLGT